MSAKMQYMGQQRQSGVAVVRIIRNGIHLEVACYKNKVLNYRSGEETRLDDVLQLERVFLNVSQGDYAKAKDIRACLGRKMTEREACEYIIKNGELQVADAERRAESGAMLRDVSTIIAQKFIHSDTRRPFPVPLIEQALKDIGATIRADQSAKRQALALGQRLVDSTILRLERAPMRIRCQVEDYVICTEEQKRERQALLNANSKAEIADTEKNKGLLAQAVNGQLLRRVLRDFSIAEIAAAGSSGQYVPKVVADIVETSVCWAAEGEGLLGLMARDLERAKASEKGKEDSDSDGDDAREKRQVHNEPAALAVATVTAAAANATHSEAPPAEAERIITGVVLHVQPYLFKQLEGLCGELNGLAGGSTKKDRKDGPTEAPGPKLKYAGHTIATIQVVETVLEVEGFGGDLVQLDGAMLGALSDLARPGDKEQEEEDEYARRAKAELLDSTDEEDRKEVRARRQRRLATEAAAAAAAARKKAKKSRNKGKHGADNAAELNAQPRHSNGASESDDNSGSDRSGVSAEANPAVVDARAVRKAELRQRREERAAAKADKGKRSAASDHASTCPPSNALAVAPGSRTPSQREGSTAHGPQASKARTATSDEEDLDSEAERERRKQRQQKRPAAGAGKMSQRREDELKARAAAIAAAAELPSSSNEDGELNRKERERLRRQREEEAEQQRREQEEEALEKEREFGDEEDDQGFEQESYHERRERQLREEQERKKADALLQQQSAKSKGKGKKKKKRGDDDE